jgi:type II secretory pathway component GspD/PulD (secretin)
MSLSKQSLLRYSACIVAAFLAQPLLGADSVAPNEPPVIRTQEDLKQGKKNVQTVMNELIQLFSKASPDPVIFQNATGMAKAYSRIIPTGDDRSILVYRPRFTSVKQMFKVIDGVVTGNTLTERLDEQNEIIINAPSKDIKNYEKLLEAMDIPSPQILIEAKVVEVTFGDGMQRSLSVLYKDSHVKGGGIQAFNPVSGGSNSLGLGGSFQPKISSTGSLDVNFQWLLTAQDAKVLSSPNILISRNEISKIVTGQDIPIQEASSTGNTLQVTSKYKNVGVNLEVEPIIVNSDNVTLRVYPKVSNVTKYENISSGADSNYSVPVISIRSVETYLRMQNKQVVIMGGLYNSRSSIQQERIPVLSDIPLIGELFTAKNESTEVTQLVFFLKVHIIPPNTVPSGVYYDPDKHGEFSERLGDIVKHSKSMPLRNTSVKKFKDEVKQAMPGKAKEDRANFHNNFDNVVKETSGVAVDKKDVKKSDKKTTAKPAAQAVEKKAKEDTKATKKVVDNKKVTKATTPVKATSKKSTPKDNKK